MARSLRIRHGTLWLGSAQEWEDLPDRLEVDGWLEAQREAPVGLVGEPRAVLVTLVCQTASGGSYFARTGGCFTPDERQRFSVRVGYGGNQGGWVFGRVAAASVLRGVTRFERPESGTLTLDCGREHPVDFKTRAFERAGALAARLICSDVAGLDDSELADLVLS